MVTQRNYGNQGIEQFELPTLALQDEAQRGRFFRQLGVNADEGKIGAHPVPFLLILLRARQAADAKEKLAHHRRRDRECIAYSKMVLHTLT